MANFMDGRKPRAELRSKDVTSFMKDFFQPAARAVNKKGVTDPSHIDSAAVCKDTTLFEEDARIRSQHTHTENANWSLQHRHCPLLLWSNADMHGVSDLKGALR